MNKRFGLWKSVGISSLTFVALCLPLGHEFALAGGSCPREYLITIQAGSFTYTSPSGQTFGGTNESFCVSEGGKLQGETSNAYATLFCRSSEAYDLTGRTQYVVNRKCLTRPDGTLGDSITFRPSYTAANIPYIISPRYTLIRNRREIKLSWNAVSNVKSYQVMLIPSSSNISPEKIPCDIGSASCQLSPDKLSPDKNRVTLIYSPPQGSLEPGVIYQLQVIVPDTNISSQSEIDELRKGGLEKYDSAFRDGVSELKFRVIGQAVEDKLSRLDSTSSKFQPDQTLIHRANYYAENKLYAEAIEMLEELVDRVPKSSTYFFLGNLYREVGLNDLALEAYNQAIQRSGKSVNDQLQALQAENELLKQLRK